MTPEEFAPLVRRELLSQGGDLGDEETLALVHATWHPRFLEEGPAYPPKLWVQCGLVSMMTQADWLTYADPRPMLLRVKYKKVQQELARFGCACCRRIWDLIPGEAFRRVVVTTESFLDGKIGNEDREAVSEKAASAFTVILQAHEARREPGKPLADGSDEAQARYAAAATLDLFFEEPGYFSAANVSLHAAYARSRGIEGAAFDEERAAQADLLRAVIPDPLAAA